MKADRTWIVWPGPDSAEQQRGERPGAHESSGTGVSGRPPLGSPVAAPSSPSAALPFPLLRQRSAPGYSVRLRPPLAIPGYCLPCLPVRIPPGPAAPDQSRPCLPWLSVRCCSPGFPVRAPPAPAPTVAGPVSARGSPFAAGLTRAYPSARRTVSFPSPPLVAPWTLAPARPHGSRMCLAPGSAVVPPLAHSVAPLAPRAPVRRLRPPAAAAAAPAPVAAVASRLPVRLRRLPPVPSVPVRR